MFRPCIDLHDGKVKQIVGGTLSNEGVPLTNFVSARSSRWYAELYKQDELPGGHVILLGPGNEVAGREALEGWPGGLQIGGGITASTASGWLDAGASHVIVTSWVFRQGEIDWVRLGELVGIVGRKRLVLDLSCRIRDGRYFVVTDRWQKFTNYEVTPESLGRLAGYCDEFLVHAVDVEGLCRGIDRELVKQLSQAVTIPVTYAGGANKLEDLQDVSGISGGKVDLTIGSALDIFGGSGVRYADAVAFNREELQRKSALP